MVISLAVLVTVVFLVWLILSLVRGEAKNSDFWWKLLVAVVILFTYGMLRL